MESSDELLERAERAMGRPFKLPHQAAAVAMDLFQAGALHGLAGDARIAALTERFRAQLRETGLDDLLGDQLRYAIRLASAGGALGYEEMHKLFSLCDEVHAIQWLGLTAAPELAEGFEAAVRARFTRQPRDARLVAEDRVEDWNRLLWWYANNSGAAADPADHRAPR